MTMTALKALLLSLPGMLYMQQSKTISLCAKLTNWAYGSALRAQAEANSLVASWLQWLVLQMQLAQRLATSAGLDADSFVNDFNFYRIGAVASSGVATLNRFTSNTATTVNVGATLITGDGSLTFQVQPPVTDTTLAGYNSVTFAAWNATTNAYTLGVGVQSLAVPVTCLTLGTAGNIAQGTLSRPGASMDGIDYTVNGAAFVNGIDAESDAALKVRFLLYIASLSKGTVSAVESAIAGVQDNLTYDVQENVDGGGNYKRGNFIVVMDDGTGAPAASLQGAVYQAIDAVRPIGSTFQVQGPGVLSVTLEMTVTALNKNALLGAIQTALTAYVNSLSVGQALPFSRLAGVVYAVSPKTILNVQNMSVTYAGMTGGAQSDVTPTAFQVVRVSTVVVS